MDLRKLKTLIDLVSESNISELEITEAEGKVRIVKASPDLPPTVLAPVHAMTPAMATPVATAPTPAAPVVAAAEATPAAEAGQVIKSPMVGTFYRSTSVGGKALVDIGSPVKEGEPVCIIEAMKIMNEIEADCSGRITRILVENGQAVEFGQPLFIVE